MVGGIGIVLLSVAGAFLYLGGSFTPNALTPARFARKSSVSIMFAPRSPALKRAANTICLARSEKLSSIDPK
jgi:hypothetical protein